MSEQISAEQKIEALLEILDELDPWTADFVQSLNEWVQHGRRLTTRQRQVLAAKFAEYDPLWLKPRNRVAFIHPVSGRSVLILDAISLLKDRLSALSPSEARFVLMVVLMTADTGRVTERAANRIKTAFVRVLPRWPESDQPAAPVQLAAPPRPLPQASDFVYAPIPGKPGYLSVTVFGATPSAEMSRIIEAAIAERATLKGPLH
jgi:hypothetical protein